MPEYCPLCLPKTRGVVIDTTDQYAVEALSQSISFKQYEKQWKRTGDTSIYVDQRLFFDSAMYWSEFHKPSTWRLRHAEIHQDELQLGDPVEWEALLEQQPDLWVSDVIDNRNIRMMYQPIVNVETASVIGYEMLARGYDEKQQQFVPPMVLFDAAREQSELFRLDRTCRISAIQAGQKLATDKLIFINFVPTSIYVPEHCLQTTLHAAKVNGIDRDRIVFEVVETDKVQDLSHLKRILDYYRKQGFRYALDDVGEGYNDIDTLVALEPDILKLDKKFVRGIQTNAENRKQAEKIFNLGYQRQVTCLAEGIETPEEARILQEIGYTWQQGYLYGKPSWAPEEISLGV